MPNLVLANGAIAPFDPARLRTSLLARGLSQPLVDEVATTVEAALPADPLAEVPMTTLDALVGNAILATPSLVPFVPDDDPCLDALAGSAVEVGVPAIEQAFVAGLLVGESGAVRELSATNAAAVMAMAETAIAGGLGVGGFPSVFYIGTLIRWILRKLGRTAAKKVAKEAGKGVAEKIGASAAKGGWKGVFKRLGVVGVEVLTFEVLILVLNEILKDPKVDAQKKDRIRRLLEQVEQGTIDPDLAAEQIERIMSGE